MKDTATRSTFVLSVVASAFFGLFAGYTLHAVGSASLPLVGAPPSQADRTGQVTTPQEALTVAFRSRPTLQRYTQYDAYRIEINRLKQKKLWGVRIVVLPESPDFEEWSSVNDDGTTPLAEGR